MKIEKMDKRLFKAQRIYALENWYRVASDDDCTVAYVPDIVTAEKVAAMMAREA